MSLIAIYVDDEEQLPRNTWRELVKLRSGYKCEDCKRQLDKVANRGARGHNPDAPHAHHKNHNDQDNRLANGECLCLSCHGKKTFNNSTYKEKLRIRMLGNKNVLGYRHSEKEKQRASKQWKGIPKTEEHKRKISEAHKKRWEKIYESRASS